MISLFLRQRFEFFVKKINLVHDELNIGLQRDDDE